jgi:hypothetical protein
LRYTTIAIVLILASMVFTGLSTNRAHATLGSLVASTTFSQNCGSGTGVGIAFDGRDLWVSCVSSSPDLMRADVNGTVTATYSLNGGLGALAYDKGANVIYAGWGGPGAGTIFKIQLTNPSGFPKSVMSITPIFTVPSGEILAFIDDGLTFDPTAGGSLYISPDTSTTIFHHALPGGAFLGSFAWAGSGCYNSGVATSAIGLMYEGSDGCSHVWVVNIAAPSIVVFDFSTVVAGDPNFRDEGLTCDSVTFEHGGSGVDVMWSKEAYSPNRAHAYEIPKASCPFGGGPGAGIKVSKFFTDTSFNPLPKDQNGNPKVDVVLGRSVVKSTNPGEIMAWVNVTNTDGPRQSLKQNDTLPVDWLVAPPWMPSSGAIHVFFANNMTTTLPPSLEITDPSTISVTTGNPQTVTINIPSFNATALGRPLMKGESILTEVKLTYGLKDTTQPATSYPRNYTDTAAATAWSGANYTGSSTSATGSASFIAYAKVLGDVDGDMSVDISDLAKVARAFGSRPGDANWNPNADLANAGVVDITDLSTVAYWFGS